MKTDPETTERELKTRLKRMENNFSCKVNTPGIVTISCVDRRRNNLVFKASLIEMDKLVLLDFRLSRGDGMEFKRIFTKIRSAMEEFIQIAPVMWVAVSTDLPGV